jgi:hypothetical protein
MIVVKRQSTNLLKFISTTSKMQKFCNDGMLSFAKEKHFVSRVGARETYLPSSLYPQYDFLFLFDHSCGHDRMPDDALRVEGMNKGYGGEQNIMKQSIIKSEDGYLGSHDHDHKLKVGDVQSMVFHPSDNGPYWMTPEEQEQTRKDHYGTTIITKEYTKPQLIEMLQQKQGIDNPKGNKQQIKDMAELAGISLTYENKKSSKAGKENQKGWNRFFGSEGGSIPAKIENFTHCMVKRIQWARSGRTRVFGTSCPTSRTLRPKKQCFNSRPGRWGYQWTGHQNAIVSLQERGLNMHGDAPRITTDDNL